MALRTEYRCFRTGQWRLTVLPEKWRKGLADQVLNLVDKQPASEHPQTLELRISEGDCHQVLFLKIFHPFGGLDSLKDAVRPSKAFRSLRQGIAMSKAGFGVPTTIAAGEKRKFRVLQRAFLLTLGIRGQSIPAFLHDCYASLVRGCSLAAKRETLKFLAEQLKCFHRLGFVHGDLVPSNIFLCPVEGGEIRFFFMDNDRTHRYPKWFPQSRWKRNLVQLNRFPLPGISLQDRVRFLRYYLNGGDWTHGDRRLLRWLERKTRQRRRECDAMDLDVSFRKLMRWDGKAAENV